MNSPKIETRQALSTPTASDRPFPNDHLQTNPNRKPPTRQLTGTESCEQGLKLKIEIKTLEAEYAELKPLIEQYCEAQGGYNSPLGSYSVRYAPAYEYPQAIELQRMALKQAEERARQDGTARIVNTQVSVAATVTKNQPKVRAIR